MADGLDSAAAAAGEGAGSPPSGSVEVEQKFLFGPGTEEKLVAQGAALVGNVSFRDQYFDTPDWRLTLADHWLRKREGAGWELKCPPPECTGISNPATENQSPRGLPQVPARALRGGTSRIDCATRYQEVTCPHNIVARVCGLLGVESAARLDDDVARTVEELGLEEFATFVTHRRKYHVDGLSVDLDEADFGYAVGEVEAVVTKQEDVPVVLKRIQEVFRQLGFEEKTKIPGKMSVYLKKFRPAHYESLVRAGRLLKVRDIATVQGQKD
ncbi:thiamine-triphosphatase [Sphaerodactylus townsendi]|uniref:Uncharacterized protein n=1 Tax=Sphaerodactylus townsendi TaxID=933632 RepID=A0ACB8EWN5_9SAUR|nr:thiamine-triphosphatase [Sphaerodactylus townsendi]